jgi:hypothetical protein
VAQHDVHDHQLAGTEREMRYHFSQAVRATRMY